MNKPLSRKVNKPLSPFIAKITKRKSDLSRTEEATREKNRVNRKCVRRESSGWEILVQWLDEDARIMAFIGRKVDRTRTIRTFPYSHRSFCHRYPSCPPSYSLLLWLAVPDLSEKGTGGTRGDERAVPPSSLRNLVAESILRSLKGDGHEPHKETHSRLLLLFLRCIILPPSPTCI